MSNQTSNTEIAEALTEGLTEIVERRTRKSGENFSEWETMVWTCGGNWLWVLDSAYYEEVYNWAVIEDNFCMWEKFGRTIQYRRRFE